MHGIRVRMFLAANGAGGGGAAAPASGAPAGGSAPVAAPAAGGAAPSGAAGKPGPKSGLTPGDQAAMAALQTGAGTQLPDGWFAAETRPEWVDARFYDAEKKAIRVADIAKSWAEADKKIMAKTEDLKSLVKQEFETERMKARPESPDKYVAKLPADFKLADGQEYKPDENNPMMAWWRKTAHDAGLSQEQFESGIAAYLDGLNYGAPDIEGELKKLGERGHARVSALMTFLKSKLGEDKFSALAPLATSAKAVEAMEALMHLSMDPALGDGARAPAPAVKSEAELRKMQMDPRYRDPFKRDPAFVKEVEEGFKRLYPG